MSSSSPTMPAQPLEYFLGISGHLSWELEYTIYYNIHIHWAISEVGTQWPESLDSCWIHSHLTRDRHTTRKIRYWQCKFDWQQGNMVRLKRRACWMTLVIQDGRRWFIVDEYAKISSLSLYNKPEVLVAVPFTVKYFSPTTNICITRVARGQHIVWGALALTLLTSVEGTRYLLNVVHVSGKLSLLGHLYRHAQLAAIAHNRQIVARYLALGKNLGTCVIYF